MNRKIRIIDKNSPFYGKVGEGRLCYYDILHGKKINGEIQDLYHVVIDGQEMDFLSHQIDVNYYHQQEDDEYREKYGYGTGDEVRVLGVQEVSSMARDFKEHDTHVIRMISYSCGLVYFTDGITCVRWPKVEIVKRAESIKWDR